MSGHDDESPIGRPSQDEFTPEERQLIREAASITLNEMVDVSEIVKRHKQHDELWKLYGWTTVLWRYKLQSLGAATLGVVVLGRDFAVSVIDFLLATFGPGG